MAVLIGMSGDVKGKTFPIDENGVTLGRAPDNAIAISNSTVSSHHAVIQREGDNYVLRDLGSTNGTRVNSHEIKEHVLKPKDLIQVGSVEFLFNSETMSFEDAQSATAVRTEVLESEGPSAMPASFNNISPFGARRRENLNLWIPIFIALGLLTLVAVIYLLIQLFTA